MMSVNEWKALGQWVRMRHLTGLGITSKTLAAMSREVDSAAAAEELPPRTVAALRLPRTDGRRARRLYLKKSVTWLLPKEYQ
jgi:hypothetical protein